MIQIHPLDQSTIGQLRSLLSSLDQHLIADVSNYAKGRQRFWLHHQWDLKDRCFSPGVQVPELWQLLLNICQPHGFVPEIGLVAKVEIGIASSCSTARTHMGQLHWMLIGTASTCGASAIA